MDIIFANKKLEKWANNSAVAKKKLGNIRADKYHQRLDDLRDAESFECLKFLPGNYHSLSGDRNGQWACDLDQPYRLIFEPISFTENQTIVLKEIRIVKIIEIVDYH